MYPSVLLIQYPSLLKANSKIGGVSISQHVLGGNDLTSPRGGTDHHFSFAIPASFVYRMFSVSFYGGRQLPFKSHISHPTISNFKISDLNISNFKISNLNISSQVVVYSTLLIFYERLVSGHGTPRK